MRTLRFRASEIAVSAVRAVTASGTVSDTAGFNTVGATGMDSTTMAMGLAGGAATRGGTIYGSWEICSGWRSTSVGWRSLRRGESPVGDCWTRACRRSIQSAIRMTTVTETTATTTTDTASTTMDGNTTVSSTTTKIDSMQRVRSRHIRRCAGDIIPTKILGAGRNIRLNWPETWAKSFGWRRALA